MGIEFLKRGKSCIYTTLFDIILDIKESWKKDSQDLLIIDEIGVQRVTENELIYITKIVDNRYSNLLPTILVGNVTQKEMASMIGERAMRRILEKCKVLVFSWKQNPNNPPRVD
ncbi:DNA replication protein DnaC [uncultured bacterium]|nr:DNA replication protein DnaC [uncultured bacterium]